MLVNKKLDRLKQWAGEKMGGEAKSAASDELKSLETEMDLRYTGMEPMCAFDVGLDVILSHRYRRVHEINLL